MKSCLLEVKGICTSYRRTPVLHNVSLTIQPGEIVALLGRNGSGKSTLLRNIMGLKSIADGEILWNGAMALPRLSPYKIPQLGISYLPQKDKLFPELTIRENIEIAIDGKQHGGNFEGLYVFLEKLIGTSDSLIVSMLRTLLESKARSKQLARSLSGGEQQVLCIARTLLKIPKLLLLDEPLANFQVRFYPEIRQLMEGLRTEGVGILLVEQKIRWAIASSDRVYIMQKGEILYEGFSGKIAADEQILLSSLGFNKR